MFKFKKTKEIKPDETKEADMTKLEALCFWDEMCSHRGV